MATRARVSLSTVSRVVNGASSVDPEIAARVRAAISELGYQRDLTASSLRRADRASTLIGLVFDDLSNPFFSAVQRGVEEVARLRGVLALAGSSDDQPEREHELAEAFFARRVDGLIVAPVSGDERYLGSMHRGETPVVFVDRPARGIAADAVTIDNVAAARRATAHLLDRGHHRIGFLGDRQALLSSRDRLSGYRRALRDAGVALDEEMVALDIRGQEHARHAVSAMLASPAPPTALFTAQNLITVGAVEALRDHGSSHSVALVGFDDIELSSALDPPLTVIAQDPFAIGRAAAELLFARIDGDRSPARHVLVPTEMMIRGSGEIPPSTPAPGH